MPLLDRCRSFLTDQFISLHFTFLPSLIGLPLTQLIKLPEGLRHLSAADRRRLSDTTPLLTPKEEEHDPYEDGKNDKTAKPARVLWRLLESLMEEHDGEVWKGETDLDTVLSTIEVGSYSSHWADMLCLADDIGA